MAIGVKEMFPNSLLLRSTEVFLEYTTVYIRLATNAA